MSKSATWVYSTTPESEGKFLDDLESFLSLVEMDQHQFHYLTLSLSEAFTNAMVHGNKWDKSKSVMVQVSVNDMEVSADITDQGRGGLAAVMNRRRPSFWRSRDAELTLCKDTARRWSLPRVRAAD